MLGAAQKAWFLERLRTSRAPWKLWGNSVGMIDWRVDFQNLPDDVGVKWPATGYAIFSDDDWAGFRHERAEILGFLEEEGIAGVASLGGDRHSFHAGVVSAASATPEPVVAEFITGSISAPGIFEAMEAGMPKNHPLRPIYLYQSSPEAPVQSALNFSMMYGVRATLALQRTGDVRQALAARNVEVAPQLSFVDTGGHGYATVRATASELRVEFVCIPRPLERNDREDGGPLAYRVTHRVPLWGAGESPRIEHIAAEGTLPLVV
jgi:alkaline phosphatase D